MAEFDGGGLFCAKADGGEEKGEWEKKSHADERF